MGWEYTVLSLEPEPVADSALEALSARMGSSGVNWRHCPYRRGRAGALRNALSMTSMIRDVRGRTDIFHCRSYFGAFFPAVASLFGSTPYVFDTRGYWVDEKIESGVWFQSAVSRAIARRVERELYDRASGVVSLTEVAAEDVRTGRFGKQHPPDRSICIPTCVDYTKFTIDTGAAPHELLHDGPVIAYVGSLNPAYEYRKALRLAAMILDRAPGSNFLALTSQVDEMTSVADEAAIPVSRRLITGVPHEEMHRWLPWIDFGLMFRKTNQANRASMPTKLAEFFATGVTPIAHGTNSDVTDWVHRAGSGLVLDDLSTDSLEHAADWVARGVPDADVLAHARLVAEKHFSLDSGAERYDTLFENILS